MSNFYIRIVTSKMFLQILFKTFIKEIYK